MDLVTGALGVLHTKLLELLKDEYKLQKGVRVQVQFLSQELESMHALRMMAAVPWDPQDKLVKIWARKVREASYDMEDILDTFIVHVGGHEPADLSRLKCYLSRLKCAMKKMGDLFSKGKARHEISCAIEDRKQLQEVAEWLARYRVDDLVYTPAAPTSIDPRLSALYTEVSQPFGIEEPRDKVNKMLTSEEGDMKTKIVSIVGFGGLGKTTLAKAVYENLTADVHFKAFVPVGQNPDLKKVLKDILIGLGKQRYTMQFNLTILDERQLIDELREFLKNKSFHIAMAQEKAPVSHWLRSHRILQRYRCAIATLSPPPKGSTTCFHLPSAKHLKSDSARDNDLCGKLSWRYEIIKRICSGLSHLHQKRSTSVIHLDLKPQNVLLDDCCVPKILVMSRPLHGSHNTAAPNVRAASTHNSPSSYVEFAIAASANGAAEIKIGSHVIRVPKYLSVHHPLVQMVLFARNKFADTFACCKSMAPKSIFDMAKRLHASGLSNWGKTIWNSAKPKSESPKVGTYSDLGTRQSIVQRNELTENESHPSDTDASGAAWVAATAAPHHATGNRDLLAGFIIEHDDQFVHAVDGVPRKVLARGAVITDSVVLPDVWFVPGLTENLVSVSQLIDLDHSVGFSRGKCCIRRTDGKVVGKGHLQEGGIYVLDFLKVPLAI